MAGFIGTSNLLVGKLTAVTGGTGVVEAGDGERIVVPLRGLPLSPGDQAELTVRPEKITLAVEPGSAGCALRGTVTEVVYLGTSTSFTVVTSTGADMVVFQQNSASAGPVPARGSAIWLCWEPEHSYLIS